jgi:hypothetical protein
MKSYRGSEVVSMKSYRGSEVVSNPNPSIKFEEELIQRVITSRKLSGRRVEALKRKTKSNYQKSQRDIKTNDKE